MVYAGNTATGASSTAATILSSGNSMCWGGIADRGAHCTNALIDTRTGTPPVPTESHKLGDGRVIDGKGDR
jgi:hypothetical protein